MTNDEKAEAIKEAAADAIGKIHVEAGCKIPRSPQFMADFSEAVIRDFANKAIRIMEGAQTNDH